MKVLTGLVRFRVIVVVATVLEGSSKVPVTTSEYVPSTEESEVNKSNYLAAAS